MKVRFVAVFVGSVDAKVSLARGCRTKTWTCKAWSFDSFVGSPVGVWCQRSLDVFGLFDSLIDTFSYQYQSS